MQCNACGTLLPPAAGSCPKCGALVYANSDYDAIPYIDEKDYQEPPASPPLLVSANTTQQPLLPADPGKYPEQKRSRSIPGWMTALIILLALLLIGEGAGSVIYAVNYRPGDLRAQATAVAQNFLTAQANSTVQASAHATAIANAMTPEQVYQQATGGTPIIDDPLKDDSGNVWYQYSGSLCSFQDGAYHIQSSTYTSGTCIGNSTEFTDLVFQAQIEIITGEIGGLMFRVNGNGNKGKAYVFFIDTHSDYEFAVGTQQQFQVLQSGTSAAIIAGLKRPNILTAIARNSHINLYVNGKSIASIIDNTCMSGQIAFIGAINGAGSFNVVFSNVKVWEL